MIDRRSIGFGAIAAWGAGMFSKSAAGAASSTYASLGYEALIFVLPLIEMGDTRARALRSGQVLNRFSHVRKLSTAKSRSVTTPNSDTLYSTAWLDVSQPVEIEIPPAGERYFSLALMDAYTNNFAVLRAADQGGEKRVSLGYGDSSSRRHIASPTRMVWALARTYVPSSTDFAAAHAVQDGLSIAQGGAVSTLTEPLGSRDQIAERFNFANRLMIENAPFARDNAVLVRLASIGIGPGLSFPPPALTERVVSEIEAGARKALHDMATEPTEPINGWIYPAKSIGNFGLDYANRARIALTGLAALPIDEALYLKGAGDFGLEDRLFGGHRTHTLTVPKQLTYSKDGFWSLSLYEATPDGQLFFFDNPLDRYSVGSNTPYLVTDGEGSYPITISADRPTLAHTNWLPAPTGRYRLQFRLFRSTSDVVMGSLPPVLPV